MYLVRENPPNHIKEIFEQYDELTQKLLYSRGITTIEEADSFLKKEWVDIDEYSYSDMRKGADRILKAIMNEETIGIYSDYDCDGIPAAAALHSTLRAFGHEDIVYYVPNRNEDGFGLNEKGIQFVKDKKVSVLCILDCGTSDFDNVEKIKEAGIDVIILDHHLPGEKVPEPFAMINPVLETNVEEPHPCAAGVTYLFVKAMINQSQDLDMKVKLKKGWEKWQLDIVSLSTLSDMVPLRDINRQLVHYGLFVMRRSRRPGIQALCRALKINQEKIAQDDLTFLIIPRINAASRMGDAKLAFKMLTTESMTEAIDVVEKLTALNNKRKTEVATMVKEANKVAINKNKDKAVWVFGNRSWKPSLVGLVAQKLVEKHGKTIFVWGQSEGKEVSVKGSCRSVKHDTFSMMQELGDIISESGGHRQAGGFTLFESAELSFEDRLNETETVKKEIEHKNYVDNKCKVGEAKEIINIYEQFAPFGKGNEQPQIVIQNCVVKKYIMFGKNKEHIKYVFSDESGEIEGIVFFVDKDEVELQQKRAKEALVSVMGLVERDGYGNKIRLKVLKIF